MAEDRRSLEDEIEAPHFPGCHPEDADPRETPEGYRPQETESCWHCGTPVTRVPPRAYRDVLPRDFRAARATLDIGQADVAERMNGVGFPEWRRQTVARVEQGKRRLTAEEVFALAWVLETSVTRLMSPIEEDHWVAFPNGKVVHAQHAIQRMRGTAAAAVRWEGNTPIFMAGLDELARH